jgi:2,4-dienoyl-CoA reductase-like NADH-dependent reductase (Old Yellow Enzyme family)
MWRKSVLFEPFTLKDMQLRNRVVMLPIVTLYAGPEGEVTGRLLAYLEARAAAGVGLVFAEASFIEKRGRLFEGELGLHDDALIPGLRRLTQTIKSHGAKSCIQIVHSGRNTLDQTRDEPPVAPSAIPTVNGPMPRMLTKAEIEELPEQFAQAAHRAVSAGFDSIEIHMAHGYLLCQFVSPVANHRTDEYGGSLENRLRLPLAVLRRVRQTVGAGYPMLVRISADEYVQGGMRLSDWQGAAPALVEAGADCIDVSSGMPEATEPAFGGLLTAQSRTSPGYMLHLAEGIKRSVPVPVIAAGRLHDPDFCQHALQDGRTDLIGTARGLLADPQWVTKAQAGRKEDIVMCTLCGGCHRDLRAQQQISCPLNPRLGYEFEN